MTEHEHDRAFAAETIRSMLASQYHAALAMLRKAVESCPDDLWLDDRPKNAFWQVAYHTLYYTHLYLQTDEAAFRTWEGHRDGVQHPDAIAGSAGPRGDLPLLPEPYSRQAVLAYLRFCDDMVHPALEAMDLHSPASGFHWYRVSKLEHQIINIRHVQHHAAQLADRLRAHADVGTRWVAAGRAKD